MPTSITRSRRNRRSRRLSGELRPQEAQVPIYITTTLKAGPSITLTFDQPVMLNGTPNFTTDLAGVTVSGATQPTPTSVVLTYSGVVFTATKLNLPYCDPAIRNASGGYVTSKQMALAA